MNTDMPSPNRGGSPCEAPTLASALAIAIALVVTFASRPAEAAGDTRNAAAAPTVPSATSITATTPAPDAPLKPPPVSDPMLSPPPEAPRRIASWDEALSLIRAQSPDYVSSYAAVERARAQKRIALAAVLPTLIGQAGYTHQFYQASFNIAGLTLVSPPPNLLSVGAGANWNILDPRAIYGVETASQGVEVARLSFADQRRTIAISVVDAMLSTLAAARVAELNRVGLRSALERLALTQARNQFGQGTLLDVDRASQDVEASRRLIVSGDESLRQAREALGAALGSTMPLAPPGDLELEQFENAVTRTCRANDDLDRRPDVMAALARVKIAERQVTAADLLFAPTVGVSSQLQHTNVAVLGPLTTWDVSAQLTVPFYDGGVRYGARRDAEATLEQAREALVSARLSAVVGSAQAGRAVGVLQSSRDVARRQRDLAARIDDRTRDGYSKGIGTSLDLVTSAQSLRNAEIDLAILEFQFAQARATAVLTNAECLY